MDALLACSRRLKERMVALPFLVPCMFLLLIPTLYTWDGLWAQQSGSQLSLFELQSTSIDNTSNNALYENHVLLCSSGSFRLIRRIQVFPEHKIPLIDWYEGKLSAEQLAEVRSLLASKDLETLPPYEVSSVMPFVSKANSKMEMVYANIYRNDKVQKTGYVIWHGHRPEDSIEGAPIDVQNEQNRAKAILSSLLQWQSGLQGTRIDNPKLTPLGCSA